MLLAQAGCLPPAEAMMHAVALMLTPSRGVVPYVRTFSDALRIVQVHASLGSWLEAAEAYQTAAEAWTGEPQQQARALLGAGVALDRAVRTSYGQIQHLAGSMGV